MKLPPSLPLFAWVLLWVFMSALVDCDGAVATHPVISELMADNGVTLADGDGDFSDWIEIYNPTASTVDLTGYFLTDDATNLTKWVFPDQSLPAGARIVVFASGKGAVAPAGELHTSFKLSKFGDYLGLVAADGSTVLHDFSPEFPAQTQDVSYGVIGGDLTAVQWMGIPTPGGVNDTTLPAPRPVVFSESSRMFTGSLSVVLTSAQNGAEIYYTTDGSPPSSSQGTLYASPISLSASTYLQSVAVFAGQTGVVAGESYIRLAADLASYESDLPMMVIDNLGGGPIPAKSWNQTGANIQQVARQAAVWATFDRDPGTGLALLTDTPQMMSRLGIRGRGAFSATWSQKPYSVEVWDDQEGEKKVAVLGMPAHSDWILYYPDMDQNKDPAMMFNTFIYELSQKMGRYSTRFRFVEAFINEDGGDLTLADRRGVYVILEKISRGKDRLDFKKLSDDGNDGSWLVGINRMDSIPVNGFPTENGSTAPQYFHTKGPNRISETSPNTSGGGDDIPRQSNAFINFDHPNGYRINPAQRTAIEGWFSQFEDVLYDNSLWLDPVDGYRKYLDADDFVDYFIFNNLTRNGDGMLLSMFPWKGDDGKLRMGPAWDYNWSSYYIGGGPTGTLMHRASRLWYGRLFDDPDFEQLYIDRWFAHRDGALSNEGIRAIVDGQAAQIGVTRALRQGFSGASAWMGELNRFKNWLTDRADWYDSQFAGPPIYSPSPGDVAAGTRIQINSSVGLVYYTLDGTDPRAPGGGLAMGAQLYDANAASVKLLVSGAPVRVLIPTDSNPASGLGWTAPAFNDSTWLSGTTGVGYDRETEYDSLIQTNLDAAMDGVNTSAYMRMNFNVEDPSVFSSLTLKMKYDDGFVAYLNGVEVARSNAPVSLSWDAAATGFHGEAQVLSFDSFSITAHMDQLVAGDNVLAIHGMNQSLSSSDFLMVPEIDAGMASQAEGIEVNSSTLITARALSGSSWSAPASGYFFVDTVPASAGNLVISEIHYRPADVSIAEAAAGFTDRDDFEFIELMNISQQTINLTDVRFIRVNDQGMEFDFSDVYPRVLVSGERVLLVRNRVGFAQRYGSSVSSRVLGEYVGNLSNDGELITLVDASGGTIQSFSYNDQAPWPEFADGGDPSLVLIKPESNPDHSIASNWRNSTVAHGNPGSSDAILFSGGDLVDYAVSEPLMFTAVNAQSVEMSYTLFIGADSANVTMESSTDLMDWQPYTLAGGVMLSYHGDGTMTYSGYAIPATAGTKFFLRLVISEN